MELSKEASISENVSHSNRYNTFLGAGNDSQTVYIVHAYEHDYNDNNFILPTKNTICAAFAGRDPNPTYNRYKYFFRSKDMANLFAFQCIFEIYRVIANANLALGLKIITES